MLAAAAARRPCPVLLPAACLAALPGCACHPGRPHKREQVLVGAHAVLANGGVISPSGGHLVALAARRHSVPLVVLVGLHKLSPLFPHDPDVTFNGARAAGRAAGRAMERQGMLEGGRLGAHQIFLLAASPSPCPARPVKLTPLSQIQIHGAARVQVPRGRRGL